MDAKQMLIETGVAIDLCKNVGSPPLSAKLYQRPLLGARLR
jgi:hypothetical protein